MYVCCMKKDVCMYVCMCVCLYQESEQQFQRAFDNGQLVNVELNAFYSQLDSSGLYVYVDMYAWK